MCHLWLLHNSLSLQRLRMGRLSEPNMIIFRSLKSPRQELTAFGYPWTSAITHCRIVRYCVSIRPWDILFSQICLPGALKYVWDSYQYSRVLAAILVPLIRSKTATFVYIGCCSLFALCTVFIARERHSCLLEEPFPRPCAFVRVLSH